MYVGFTGTQVGMTPAQVLRVREILIVSFPDPSEMWGLHGDCIGADAEFHQIVRRLGGKIWLHPPTNPAKRAFCDYDRIETPAEYKTRNHAIVDHSEVMLATPKEASEVQRSGTWATARYAKKQRELSVVYPNGELEKFYP